MLSVFIKINARIDSRNLWEKIARYGINLTDLGDYSLIYGDIYFEDLINLLYICSEFDKVEINYIRNRG